jgi:hypothetical protein
MGLGLITGDSYFTGSLLTGSVICFLSWGEASDYDDWWLMVSFCFIKLSLWDELYMVSFLYVFLLGLLPIFLNTRVVLTSPASTFRTGIPSSMGFSITGSDLYLVNP